MSLNKHDAETLEIALIALRRISSMDRKNVEKYAQEIASEALERVAFRYVRVDSKVKS